MNNFHKKVLVFIIILLIFGIGVVFVFDVNCVFKTLFHIACPGCGLTRGFRALFHLNIKDVIYYNILTIPIFLFLTGLVILFLTDLIKKKDYTEIYLKTFVKKHVIILIIILLIITMIINNIHSI